MRISRIRVKRYRSINDVTLLLEKDRNLVTICGENNTGKTNLLRAVSLFFNPTEYEASRDAPYHKFYGSRGQTVYPEIEVDFEDQDEANNYRIRRTFELSGTSTPLGWAITPKGRKKQELETKQIASILDQFAVPLVEVANVSLPEIVQSLVTDAYDIQFANARFRGVKKDLRSALEKYRESLIDLLNDKLASEIEPLLSGYNAGWRVRFDMADVAHFRDLITDDVRFVVDDRSGAEIAAKGSGLQRLASLALYFYIARNSRKQVILLIDEPDSFLHHGLQRKLAQELARLSEDSQVFITTHSPVFIDTAGLRNVFLLDISAEKKPYKRRNQSFDALSTHCVDIAQVDGAKQIRAYLGLSEDDYDVLDNCNLLVEGETDEVYLTELLKYFGLPVPRIVVANGASNYSTYLDFYDSFYKGTGRKPRIMALLDNDGEGRNTHNSLSGRTYSSIDVTFEYLPHATGQTPPSTRVNWEVEDFMYPSVMCELASRFLGQAGLNEAPADQVLAKATQPAFLAQGILAVLDHEKNAANPSDGARLSLEGPQGKKGMARQFRLVGDKNLSDLVAEQSAQYPEVERFLKAAISTLTNAQISLPTIT